MNQTLRDTLLGEAVQLFKREGVLNLDQKQIIRALDISPVTFAEMFHDKDDLLLHAVRHDIERQKNDHVELYKRITDPVGRLLGLLELGIQDLQTTSPAYIADLVQHYPQVLAISQQHFEEYSNPQLQQLLNEGVLQKQLRGDINIGLVTKIILAQLNMMLDQNEFPAQRYGIAEVFRSVYLYYIRGLCTEEGMQKAAAHFARM